MIAHPGRNIEEGMKVNAVLFFIVKLHKLCSEIKKIAHVNLHNMPAITDLKTT
jgi:hypothetical protein